MVITEQQQLGRAKNAVLEFFENRISVPKIYLDATWDGHQVDVLAIDREGAGDVHAVLLFPIDSIEKMEQSTGDVRELMEKSELIERFALIPAQYKYIATVSENFERAEPRFFLPSSSYWGMMLAPDGMGRIGFMRVSVPIDGEAKVTLEVKPERFRARIAQLANDYIENHTADWELRA